MRHKKLVGKHCWISKFCLAHKRSLKNEQGQQFHLKSFIKYFFKDAGVTFLRVHLSLPPPCELDNRLESDPRI